MKKAYKGLEVTIVTFNHEDQILASGSCWSTNKYIQHGPDHPCNITEDENYQEVWTDNQTW